MKPTIIRSAVPAMLSVAWLAMTTSAFAAETKEDPWRFGVTIPLWAPSLEGEMTVRGRTADVDLGFDDLWDHLDAALALSLEARKERFGFHGNFGYMKFSADPSARGVSGDAELKFLVADAGIAYRLVKRGEQCPFILEGIAGIRYWHIETELELIGPRGGVLVDGHNNFDLLDPIVGLRGTQYFAEKWHFDFQGDVGGFGLYDHASHFDWSAMGLVTYDATRWLSLSAGYRALATNVDGGSGSSKKGVDIIMHGLLLAAQIKF